MTMQEIDQLREVSDAAVEVRRAAQLAVAEALAELGAEVHDSDSTTYLLNVADEYHIARGVLLHAEKASQLAKEAVEAALAAWWAQGCRP